MTSTPKEVAANYVPAAAVIRRRRTLLGITGLKGRVGGMYKLELKAGGSTVKLAPILSC